MWPSLSLTVYVVKLLLYNTGPSVGTVTVFAVVYMTPWIVVSAHMYRVCSDNWRSLIQNGLSQDKNGNPHSGQHLPIILVVTLITLKVGYNSAKICQINPCTLPSNTSPVHFRCTKMTDRIIRLQ